MDLRAEDVMAEFFKYDEGLPLETVETDSNGGGANSREYHVAFTSAHDQRVTALLTVPLNVSPPFPAVLVLHGVFGHQSATSRNRQRRVKQSVSIDGLYCGERQVAFAGGIGLQTQYYYRNRDAMIQTTIDLMRAVDYLASRDDIEMRRIGFVGFSMGGAIGTLFCAHDQRVKAVVLGITGGDFRKLNIHAGDAHSSERMLRTYRIVDPVFYVSKISPRPLLMLNASHDQIVPRAATEALFEAARQPKNIIWYDCGHADLPDGMLDDMKNFFDVELWK